MEKVTAVMSANCRATPSVAILAELKTNDTKASLGWLQKFLRRHNFVLRKKTSVCQKLPSNNAEAVAKFISFVEQRRKAKNNFPGGILATDETAVWFDFSDCRCIEIRKAPKMCDSGDHRT
ncbi:hypothetical protein niasHT_010941 [Heterodera trifolii]|uniref:HTH CENPB-type domain-containing protein n=1 Tax=Heterodera trifolii TaxID=157864 RepID=A0ABD2LFX2_9BILA